MGRKKEKKLGKTTSALGILLSIIALAIAIFSQGGTLTNEEIAKVNANLQTETGIAEEIVLTDENLHIVFFDVGQADCILVQNKRNNNAN